MVFPGEFSLYCYVRTAGVRQAPEQLAVPYQERANQSEMRRVARDTTEMKTMTQS